MFGFFKKNKKQEIDKNRSEKRKKQRRLTENVRRESIRWEPDKEDRRSQEERRKGSDKWEKQDR